MGFYVNPERLPLIVWLREHATKETNVRPEKHREGDSVVVCLFRNPGFPAAMICYSQDELEQSDYCASDMRPRVWYFIPRKLVLPFLFGQEIET